MNGSRLLGATAASASALILSLVLVPAAAADEPPAGPVATPVHGGTPTTLAATGLNLAVPLIVGLAALLIGLALIAWGVLRRGPQRH